MKIKKMLLLAIPMLTLGSGALLLSVENASVVKAEETAVTEESEKVEGKFENFKNTYLVPILSSVSITAILSFALSLSLSIYNSTVNKRTRHIVGGCVEQTLATLKVVSALTSEFQENKEVSKETLKVIDDSFKKLLEQLKLLEKATKRTEQLKEAIVVIGEMQKELAKVDKQIVSSGIAKTLVELEAKLKEIE